MEANDLLHKRCLIKDSSGWGNSGTITEVKILEVSPTGQWTKLMNSNGYKFWRATDDISLIEVLKDLKTGKPKD